MIGFAIENIAVFPEVAQDLLLSVFSALLCSIAVWGILKILQSKEFMTFFRSAHDVMRKMGNFLHSLTDDPTKRSKPDRFSLKLIAFTYFIYSAILFLFFFAILLLWVMTDSKLSFVQNMTALSLCFFCVYTSAIFKTQGNKELLKIREAGMK